MMVPARLCPFDATTYRPPGDGREAGWRASDCLGLIGRRPSRVARPAADVRRTPSAQCMTAFTMIKPPLLQPTQVNNLPGFRRYKRPVGGDANCRSSTCTPRVYFTMRTNVDSQHKAR